MEQRQRWGDRGRQAARAGALAAAVAIAAALPAPACVTLVSFDEYQKVEGGEGGSGGTESAGGAGGAPVCEEIPCRLNPPQCGCGEGQKCTYDTKVDVRTCVEAGELPSSTPCDPNDDRCMPGSICAPLSDGGHAVCQSFCASNADCEPGSLCVDRLYDPVTLQEVPGLLLCTEICELLSSNGCPPGTACHPGLDQSLGVYFTQCRLIGGGQQGFPCDSFEDCAPSHGCVNIGPGSVCSRYCDAFAPDCEPGLYCESFGIPLILQGVEYGYCTF